LAEDRFPRPQFETGYALPAPTMPAPRAAIWNAIDTTLLLATLALATVLALKRRSRREIFLLSLFSLIYFGFWRRGCICPVGSVQNTVLALADPGYALPLTVLAFFSLPLVFSLFFGRTFCAAVCPLGAIQDLFVLRPVRLPRWLKHGLGLIPSFALGATVLIAAAGGHFLTCRYDPFVGFFRRSGPASMLIAGGVLLALGVFVARPYCRFLCPYGVLLRGASRLSRRHVTITPDQCIDCRLCEDACPFDAIRFAEAAPSVERRRREVRRVAVVLAALPLVVLAGAWAAGRIAPRIAGAQLDVRIARELAAAPSHAAGSASSEAAAFREAGVAPAALFAAVSGIERRFVLWSRVAGGAVALLIMLKLLRLSMYRRVAGHEPDRGECFSCGRCFEYCPVHRLRRERGDAAALLEVRGAPGGEHRGGAAR
jgi:NAD-dependent dihydropyrimidine dehydrogenase PreA subunit